MKVLMLADVSNLYYTLRNQYGAALDYGKFRAIGCDWDAWESGQHPTNVISKAIAYGSTNNTESSAAFQVSLRGIGYQLKFKQPNEYFSGDKLTRKADWDVGIAIDAIRFLEQYDLLVLGCADGDMAPLVEYLLEKGKSVFIYACGISKDLKNTGARWQEIGPECFYNKD